MVQHKRLTVVQVLPTLESGGVERGTLEVAAELVRRGHRSIVISAGGRMVQDLVAHGSEHIDWPIGKKSLSTLKFVWRLRRLLRDQQINIIHVRSRLPAWIVWLAWRGMLAHDRPHFITTVHGRYSVNRYSAIMLKGEQVIAVSETIRQYILENYPQADPDKITLIPRGIDPHEFPHGYCPDEKWSSKWYEMYPQLKHKKVLVLPGRITRLKGHDDFINLIFKLREKGLPMHGVIVGEEDPRRREYAQELHTRVHKLGLDSDITFTGYRADMKEIYAVSDIILSLSSKPESFGRTALEALKVGTPVVAYEHGGVGEILRDIFPEGRVPVSDFTLLMEKVIGILNVPPTVGSNTSYSLQAMLDSEIEQYIKVVQ